MPDGALAFEKETYTFGENVTVQCKNGFIPIGDMITTCNENGTFTDLFGYCNSSKFWNKLYLTLAAVKKHIFKNNTDHLQFTVKNLFLKWNTYETF